MAKIPFNVKFRPQIESGEYKVETRDGNPTRIVCWDLKGNEDFFILALVEKNEKEVSYCYPATGCCKAASDPEGKEDLFIVTPGPELNEFEQALKDLCWKVGIIGDVFYKDDIIKKTAAGLLDLARKEIEEELKEKVLHDYWKQASDKCAQERKEAKAEALKEFEEKYKQSWFDEGKIAGRFEGLTENEKYQQGVHDGKEEALKDLPMWRAELEDREYVYGFIGGFKENPRVYLDGHSIDLYSLRKLPGFNED